jgi:hypothetical protein
MNRYAHLVIQFVGLILIIALVHSSLESSPQSVQANHWQPQLVMDNNNSPIASHVSFTNADLVVTFQAPDDADYWLSSFEGRFDVTDPSFSSRATASIFTDNSGIPGTLLTSTTAYLTGDDNTSGAPFEERILLNPGGIYHLVLAWDSTAPTLSWAVANDNPTGVLSYLGSMQCNPTCTPLNAPFVIRLWAFRGPAEPANRLPCNRTTVSTTPTFTWDASPTAIAYRVWIYTKDRSFEDKHVVTTTSYQRTQALQSGSLYIWRVRAKSANNTWGHWSDTCLFRTS